MTQKKLQCRGQGFHPGPPGSPQTSKICYSKLQEFVDILFMKDFFLKWFAKEKLIVLAAICARKVSFKLLTFNSDCSKVKITRFEDNIKFKK